MKYLLTFKILIGLMVGFTLGVLFSDLTIADQLNKRTEILTNAIADRNDIIMEYQKKYQQCIDTIPHLLK